MRQRDHLIVRPVDDEDRAQHLRDFGEVVKALADDQLRQRARVVLHDALHTFKGRNENQSSELKQRTNMNTGARAD